MHPLRWKDLTRQAFIGGPMSAHYLLLNAVAIRNLFTWLHRTEVGRLVQCHAMCIQLSILDLDTDTLGASNHETPASALPLFDGTLRVAFALCSQVEKDEDRQQWSGSFGVTFASE
eukprot:3357145-Amphidinium_carterae.1